MDNKLLLSLIVSALDNRTLAALSRTALWPTISELVSSDYYWYQRVQHLSSREIAYRSGDWKAAYYLLSEAIHLRDPFMREVVVSPLAVSILIEMGFDPSVDDSYILRLASGEGQTEVVRLLLKDGRSDPSAGNSYALRLTSLGGHTEVVRLLLKDGRSDPTAYSGTALVFSAEEGHIEVVRLLLEDSRVDPSADDSRALWHAASRGQTEAVRLLLEDGRADPTANGGDALRLATRGGHTEVIRLLIEDGRDAPTLEWEMVE